MEKAKKILNFNYRSYTAWTTLLAALLSVLVSVLKLFGIEVTPDQTAEGTVVINAVLTLLAALGIITAPTDNKNKEVGKKKL